MANFVSYANATELMEAIAAKFNALPAGIIPRGSSTFANLPTTLTAAMLGYAYNVSTEFTTTALFVEGAGKEYPAGTNVVVVNNGDAETPDYKYDVYGNFIDVDAINDRIDDVREMITDNAFDETSAYAIGDIVSKDDSLYRFKAAHTENTSWDATEVDKINVLDLITDAEPDSLTTAQVNALLALLD